MGSEIKATCNGIPEEVRVQGRYALFEKAEKGKEYSLEYHLKNRITEENKILKDKYQII